MSEQKVKISIDSNNNYYGFDKPIVSSYEIEYFGLKEGDLVIGYQDEQEWEGIVKYDNSLSEELQWYIELDLGKEKIISSERKEGREEGARSAIPIGEIRGEVAVVTNMLIDGIDFNTVKKYTRLPEKRLRSILDSIKNDC